MPPEGRIDHDALARLLTALAYPARLELLELLRVPKGAGEIKLTPRQGGEAGSPERAAARQTIQAHLDKLVATGLVHEESQPQGERARRLYSVNPQKLYALTEEMRRLSVIHAGHGTSMDGTVDLGAASRPRPPPVRGPRLVLAHGVYEGKVFALHEDASGPPPWYVGRKKGLAVSLDYDPFVSSENARLTKEQEGVWIENVEGSRNGTRVNWEPLSKGTRHRLLPGDLVGVGRSLLVFVDR